MTFHVGQKVVCVDDVPRTTSRPYLGWPRVGNIYTIRAIEPAPNEEIGVLLEEIIRCEVYEHNGRETSFYPDRFRPVIERKTDISIFTEMLTSNKAKERA